MLWMRLETLWPHAHVGTIRAVITVSVIIYTHMETKEKINLKKGGEKVKKKKKKKKK